MNYLFDAENYSGLSLTLMNYFKNEKGKTRKQIVVWCLLTYHSSLLYLPGTYLFEMWVFFSVTRMTIKRMNNSRNKYLKNSSLMRKEGSLMRNFSSLHNKHRDAEGRLGEQRMWYFRRTEDGILNPCSQRFVPWISSTSPVLLFFLNDN